MKIESIITKLRERPEEERLAIAAGAALVVGVILFLLWGITFFISGGSGSREAVLNQQASVPDSFKELRSEFEQRGAQFKTQYEQLRRALEAEGVIPNEQTQGESVVELSLDEEGEVRVEEVFVDDDVDVIE